VLTRITQEESSSESDSDSESEDEKKPAAKKAAPAAKKAAAKKEESSDESSSESESEDEKPAAKKAKVADGKASKTKKAESSDSDSDSSSDEEEEKAGKRKAPEASTPAAASSGNCRIFLGGLPFRATEKDIKDMFGKCGDITSVELPIGPDGRPTGFGFLVFKDASAVAKAVAMDGEEMQGRWLKVKEADGSENKRAQGLPKEKPEGCTTVFIGNLSFNVEEEEVRACFAECGEIASCRFATDRETGEFKGFGHIEFVESSATEKAVALAGTMVAGRGIRVDYAEARKPGGTPGSAGGGRGGGGGGRGGRGGFGGGGGRGGFGSGGRGGGAPNKNKGSIAAHQGTKISFDD
jgi:nucleolin